MFVTLSAKCQTNTGTAQGMDTLLIGPNGRTSDMAVYLGKLLLPLILTMTRALLWDI